jgi:hypothetical protein
MAPDEMEHGELIAQAAQASAEDTVEAIDQAAALNDDPKVARALDTASLRADKTASRVSWLRGFMDRFVGTGTA